MRKFFLLRLKNCANLVIDEIAARDLREARDYFAHRRPAIGLDLDGYAKHADGTSYCIAQTV